MRDISILLFIALITFSTYVFSEQAKIITNKFGIEFVLIPAGSFQMGTTDQDRQIALTEMKLQSLKKHDMDNYQDEQVRHRVTISNAFLLGRVEVTQQQWLKIMQNRPGPEEYWQRSDWKKLPVVSISWNMAQRFVVEMSKMDAEYDYRLPTEAEWEYAARAGSEGLRAMSLGELKNHAWYFDNSGDEPHPVATLPENAFGLYDMLGNAWEWVADWYSPDIYADGTDRIDPAGPATGQTRIRRGGSYHCPAVETRPGFREANTPETRYTVTGFRVVATPASLQH